MKQVYAKFKLCTLASSNSDRSGINFINLLVPMFEKTSRETICTNEFPCVYLLKVTTTTAHVDIIAI